MRTRLLPTALSACFHFPSIFLPISHIFRGGKFLAVYWMGGDSAEPYRYDKAIKLALSSLDSK
ncbi:hypothetical protein JI735_22250 [Paenibacillus sonchi]|uniref:Uncharacterized protein n=1 Tax=Paenibacillus sonchi TaxID=373687 RepID=A0A974SBP7_9BACL|nr:hypothetical protein [Paenibacillus sonchi]QQZ59366.1 hypothetical protein JI735_22250 [Paenibacillus sonchi]